MKNKILIITDSKTHKAKDDLFYLIREFIKQKQIIYILDRALDGNNLFFQQQFQEKLFLYKVENKKINLEFYKETFTNTTSIDNEVFDLIFLRIDRPISDHLLNYIENFFNNSLIVNRPKGIIQTASKEFLFNLKEVCPPMKLCKSYKEIEDFSKFFAIVVKPLKGYGGTGICRIINKKFYFENTLISKEKFQNIINNLLEKENKVLAVKYLKNVYEGDKRIYVVNGNIIGAINRVPKENSWLGNVQYGATIEKIIITNKDKIIIKKINNILKNQGIYIYGADILQDDNNTSILSEINTLNVGGCQAIDALYNSSCIKEVVGSLLSLLKKEKINITQ